MEAIEKESKCLGDFFLKNICQPVLELTPWTALRDKLNDYTFDLDT